MNAYGWITKYVATGNASMDNVMRRFATYGTRFETFSLHKGLTRVCINYLGVFLGKSCPINSRARGVGGGCGRE
jgi:hypothetical protein